MGYSCEGLSICQDLLGFQVFTELKLLTEAEIRFIISTARLSVSSPRGVNMD